MPAAAATGGGSRLPMHGPDSHGGQEDSLLGGVRRPHRPAAVSGPSETHRHRRPETHLLCPRPRLHPAQLPRTGLPLRGSPFPGLGGGRPNRYGQTVFRLRMRPRGREPGRMAHGGDRKRATRLDGWQWPAARSTTLTTPTNSCAAIPIRPKGQGIDWITVLRRRRPPSPGRRAGSCRREPQMTDRASGNGGGVNQRQLHCRSGEFVCRMAVSLNAVA